MSTVQSTHKRNLGGGKGHKKGSSKEHRGHRMNRETAEAFVTDVMEGADLDGVSIARVLRSFGGAKMQIQTVEGKEMTVGMKGTLRCSKGAAKRADNPIALSVGSFVIVQVDSCMSQIAGVLSRAQVCMIQKKFPDAPKSFFAEGEAAIQEENGFEWDLDEEIDVAAI